MRTMTELMAFLRPEIALFAGTCVVMLLGLSKAYAARKACALVSGVAIAIAGVLAMDSPAGRDGALASAILPDYLPYAKTMIAAVALLILPMLAGTVDRLCIDEERVRVVDFKTGRNIPSGVADIPATHRAQMEAYAEALRVIFPGRTIESSLLYTAGPKLIQLTG